MPLHYQLIYTDQMPMFFSFLSKFLIRGFQPLTEGLGFQFWYRPFLASTHPFYPRVGLCTIQSSLLNAFVDLLVMSSVIELPIGLWINGVRLENIDYLHLTRANTTSFSARYFLKFLSFSSFFLIWACWVRFFSGKYSIIWIILIILFNILLNT